MVEKAQNPQIQGTPSFPSFTFKECASRKNKSPQISIGWRGSKGAKSQLLEEEKRGKEEAKEHSNQKVGN